MLFVEATYYTILYFFRRFTCKNEKKSSPYFRTNLRLQIFIELKKNCYPSADPCGTPDITQIKPFRLIFQSRCPECVCYPFPSPQPQHPLSTQPYNHITILPYNHRTLLPHNTSHCIQKWRRAKIQARPPSYPEIKNSNFL